VALPVIADTFRIVLHGLLNPTQHTVNVLHVRAPGKSASQVYAALDTNATANMWHAQNTAWGINEVDVTPLDGSGSTSLNSTGTPAKWSGTRTGETMPAVANLIKMVTAKRGPAFRGRLFLGPVCEDAGANGIMSSGLVTACTAAWVAFANALAAGGFQMVVASYLHSSAENVTNIACENMFGTQRRRQTRLRT
jgi:hypothetical protein